MKKIAITVAAFSVAGLALAPLASAEQAPVTEGPHTMTFPGGGQSTVNVAYDCGPDCFSLGDHSARDEFRFDGARWLSPDGLSTVDGHTFLNKNGKPATLT
jgi:hypothetical protein